MQHSSVHAFEVGLRSTYDLTDTNQVTIIKYLVFVLVLK